MESYSQGGRQSVNAYDLSKVASHNLVMVDKALWNVPTVLKFFEPINPEHVSHSISNYQNSYSKETSYIEVEAITMSNLLESFEIEPNKLSLIKLDIEGAEIEVLTDCMEKGIFPKQILVEFDELNLHSKECYGKITRMNEMLVKNGYKMITNNGQADFLYYRECLS